MNQPRWRRPLMLIIKSTIKYPTIRYRQRQTSQSATKSILDKVNYSRWKSKSDNDEVRLKSQSAINEGNRQSTINSHRQSPTIASQHDNLLNYHRHQYASCQATMSTYKMADNMRSDNSKHPITIGNQKLYTPKARTAILSPKESQKRKGCWTYPESQGNFALVDAVAQQCLSTGAFGQYPRWQRRAKTNCRHRLLPTTIGPIRFGTTRCYCHFTNYYRTLSRTAIKNYRQLFLWYTIMVDYSSLHRTNEWMLAIELLL